jgi:Major Facilitator Superfamily
MQAPRHTAQRVVTAVCFAMAVLAWGTVFYGHSIYMDELTRGHGWSTGLISSAILVFWIASLPGVLFVGTIVDRLGPVPVVATGGICIGLGLAALGSVTASWQLYPVYAAMGFGYPALAGTAISATLASWFDRGFGSALAVALTGASVGGALVPLVIISQTARYGFAPTMAVAGGMVLAIAVVICLVLTLTGRPRTALHAAADQGAPAYSMRATVLRGRFWRISIAAALGLGGQAAFLAHQVPIIVAEHDRTFAALMITVVAVAAALGRLIVGLLSRSIPARGLAALSYLVHGAGIGTVAVSTSQIGTFAGCALAGLVVGAIVMLPPILVREDLGVSGFGRTYAMVNVVMYVMAGLTPWMVGVMRDAFAGYTVGLLGLVVIELIAAVIIIGARRERIAESEPIVRP